MSTSWEDGAKWYSSLVGDSGHYYHTHVIFPRLKELIQISTTSLKGPFSMLDLACGSGALLSLLPNDWNYSGVDASKSLIEASKKRLKSFKGKKADFICADITKPIKGLKSHLFSHAAIILAVQNLKDPLGAFKTASSHLEKGAPFYIVLNHPCFRIPRQSHWEIDESKNLQYRRIDRYLSPLEIPLQIHPGKKNTKSLAAFHYSLSDIFAALVQAGFYIEGFEEWVSNKTSSGKAAKRENRARKEFPLFCCIVAVKR
jgi:SAM-dependent methyltransferase